MPVTKSYLENPAIRERLERAPSYAKAALTALRLPRPEEKGLELVTYVRADPTESAGSTVRVEARNTIGDEHVIARNPGFQGILAGQPVFNEWLIDRATAQKNYGADVIAGLGPVFTSHRKIATLRLIELDQALLQELGIEGDEFAFPVSWSDQPMVARRGDFLTDQGYSIGAQEIATYVRV
jgi:hypothetical protein